jgi:hypothetical protein
MLYIFGEHIGSTVEAYVDDIVVKSRIRGDLIQDLKITFGSLRTNNIKLNSRNVYLACLEACF